MEAVTVITIYGKNQIHGDAFELGRVKYYSK